MSEDTKAPATPSAPEPQREVEAPMMSFVKGGTVTMRYENDLAARRADAEQRRDQQVSQFNAVKKDPVGARMQTADLGSQQKHPAIVLEIQDNNRTVTEYIRCELTAGRTDPEELVLVLCCPYCAVKYGSAEAQIHISSKNKRLYLDIRRAGELWVNPLDVNEMVTLAGTITMEERAKCPGLGCTWAFRIDNSVIKPV